MAISPETNASLKGQPRGVQLEYRVKAINKAGQSEASNTIAVVLGFDGKCGIVEGLLLIIHWNVTAKDRHVSSASLEPDVIILSRQVSQ